MTENEAIEIIKRTPLMRYIADRNPKGELGEALEMAVEALEKQIPKKPIYSDYDDNGLDEIIPYKAACPICGHEFEFGTWNDEDSHHCVCGQRLDWGE